jgi:thiol-disulfide isomerase/thioredoxin
MHISFKSFCFGLCAGIALALIALQLWSSLLAKAVADNSQPHLLHPFVSRKQELTTASSNALPRPWFPGEIPQAELSWRIQPVNGRPGTLSDFAGNVVFLNFWSTSCAPCIEEMPGIMRLMQTLGEQRIIFAAVAAEDASQVETFLETNKLTVPVCLSGKDRPQNLPVPGVPVTYILDKDGSVVARFIGAQNWDDDGARAYLRRLASR